MPDVAIHNSYLMGKLDTLSAVSGTVMIGTGNATVLDPFVVIHYFFSTMSKFP